MILIRRLLTIPLAILFFALILVAVLLLAVNERFLQSNAYPELLVESEIYTFAMGPLLTTALDEARELPASEFSEYFSDNPLVLSGLTTEEISASLNRAFPPDWMQELVDTSFEQVGGYILGERDEFTVEVQTGEQVRIIVSEFQSLLRKARAYDLLYDEWVDPLLEEFVQEQLPLDVDVPVSRLSSAARTILQPDWIQSNVEGGLDEVTSYMVGETDQFRIHIPFDDRAEIAAEEFKDILAESDVYEVVYDEVIEPLVKDVLDDSIDLPVGISIDEGEVIAAMRAAAPVSWVQDQAEYVIDTAVPYLIGREDDFVVTIDLSENKVATRQQIDRLVVTKLEALLDLSTCTARQMLDLWSVNGLSDIPECIPPGMPTEELATQISQRIGDQAHSLVIDQIPDTVEFTQSTLLSQLGSARGEDSVERLDDLQELLSDGFTYTNADLKADLVSNDILSLETFEDIRSFLADGWSYTEEDLEERVVEAGGMGTLDTFHNLRKYFAWANTFRWLVYLPMAFLLLLIGMLGGRTWRSRFAWAGTFLTVGATIAFIVSGPVYDSFGSPRIDDLKDRVREEIQEDGIYFIDTRALATEKLLELSQTVADDFRNSLYAGSRNLLIAGVLVVILSGGLGFLSGSGRKRTVRPDAQSTASGQSDYSNIFRNAKEEYDRDA